MPTASNNTGVVEETEKFADSRDDPLSHIPLSEMLDVTLPHLRTQVPTDTSEAFSNRARLAYASLKALATLDCVTRKSALDTGRNLLFARRIEEAWDDVYSWLAFIFASRVEGLVSSDPRRDAASFTLVRVWCNILWTDAQPLLQNAPGAVKMATRLWQNFAQYSRGLSVQSQPLDYGTYMFYNFLSSRKRSEQPLEEIVAEGGGDAKTFSKRAVAQLVVALAEAKGKQENNCWTRVGMLIDIIDLFHLSEPMFDEFLANHVTIIATKALRELVLLPDGPPVPHALNRIIQFLSHCFEVGEGFLWFAQAVKSGFIDAFCAACVFLLKSGNSSEYLEVMKDTFELSMTYLVYRSVIEAVVPACREARHGPLMDIIKSCPPAFLKFETFKGLAEGRFHLLKDFRTKGSDDKQHLQCFNSSCKKKGSREDGMRRCTGCRIAHYCSKECQTKDWKAHKPNCKYRQQHLEETEERRRTHTYKAPQRDMEFLAELMVVIARDNIRTVRAAALLNFPHLAPTELVICIDHTVYPLKFSVKPLEGFSTATEPHHTNAAVESIRRAVKAANGRTTMISMAVPFGKYFQNAQVAAPSFIWTPETMCEHHKHDTRWR